MSYYKIRNSSANHGNGNNNGNGGMTEGNNSIHNHSFGNHNNPLQEPNHQNRKMSTASSFEVIRSTRSSDSFSSMFSGISQLPNNRNSNSSNPFTAHFEAINRLPLDHWLKVQKMPMEKEEEENEEIMEEEEFEETNESGNDSMVSGLKVLLSNLQLMQEQTDEQLKRMMEQLERMIVNDDGSGQQKRIHPQQKMQQMQFNHPQQNQQQLFAFQPPKLTATMITDEKENGEKDQNGEEEEEKKSIEKLPSIPLKLPSDPAHWLKKYPPPKQNRPMNEQAEDVSCWESVLGWKRILEKIHASGEHVWLAPSSRSIKN